MGIVLGGQILSCDSGGAGTQNRVFDGRGDEVVAYGKSAIFVKI